MNEAKNYQGMSIIELLVYIPLIMILTLVGAKLAIALT